MKCEKRWVFVVTAFYQEELYMSGETPMTEEETFLSYPRAMKAVECYENDPDFESVNLIEEEREVYYNRKYREVTVNDSNNKDFYKKCYRALAKNIHPDISGGDTEAMQYLNQLKCIWGV